MQCPSVATWIQWPLQFPMVPSMKFGAFDTLEILGQFIILVLLNFDRHCVKLQPVPFQCLHYHLIHSLYDNS